MSTPPRPGPPGPSTSSAAGAASALAVGASTPPAAGAPIPSAAGRRRVACLLIPDLPLHAALRAEPELADQALVVTTGPGPRAEILCASRAATAGGVQPGQSLTQARAIRPGLEVRIASPVLERAARAALLDVALSLSPRAELVARSGGFFAAEGAVCVDATGITALHENEGRFASVLHARAERAGLRGFVALASSRGIARLAARHLATSARRTTRPHEIETTRVLSPQKELAFLAPLPIDLLDPDDDVAESLSRFGLHTLRDLLGLSRRDLAARVGPAILELVARARGEEIEPPLAEPRSLELEEGIDLEWPLANLEPLAFVLRGLASRLTERLALRALGCAELDLALRLESGARDERRIALASPTGDASVLLRLIRQALESRPPVAAVDGLVLTCRGVALRREQLDLFRPRGPDPNQLDQTLAALGAICGPARVGAPAVVDDHRPDAFALQPFSGRSVPAVARTAGAHTATARLTLRAIRPPAHAEVRSAGGRPVFLRSAVARGEIVEVAGPWRTTGRWWSETGHFAVDHYDVQMHDGRVLRLCFDWRENGWQVDGLYD
ncbi:MAG: DNA polymerase Y family protein [Myxococcota bacterium]